MENTETRLETNEFRKKLEPLSFDADNLICIIDDVLKFYIEKYNMDLHEVSYIAELARKKLDEMRKLF